MSEIILHLFEILATYTEVFIGMCICGIVYSEKNTSVGKRILGSSIVTVVVWMLNQYQLFSLGITSVAIAGITICTYSMYKELNIEVVFVAILYFALVYIIDFLSITFVGILIGKTELANAISKAYSVERIYLLILSKALLMIISKLLINNVLSNVSIQVRKFRIGIVLLVGVIYFLVQNTLLKIDIDITIAWFFLLVLFLLSIYTAMQYIKHLEEKKRWEWNIERIDVLIENYDKLITMYQEKQTFYHDLKNHYLILGKLMRNKEYEKANEYLVQLSLPEYESWDRKRTGIRTIDILINHKIIEAEKYGISIETEIDSINLRFSEQEMVILLGNIFDNAIEACRNVTSGAKWIKIQIKTQYNMLFIKVSNIYEHRLNYKNGKYISLKENPQQHGWGISSIKMIAERHEGIVKIDTDENIFTIFVSFFY